MKYSTLAVLFLLGLPVSHADPATPWDWVDKIHCDTTPVLVGPNGDNLDTTDVRILLDRSSGSVMVTENHVCTQVYFHNPLLGEAEAHALGCHAWLNYDVPTFSPTGYNIPARLTPGKGGDWSRAIRLAQGKLLLEMMTVIPATDPDQNSYPNRTIELPGCQVD